MNGYPIITNLNGLNVLTSIGGTLKISNTHLLSVISSLNNLSFIGGDFYILFNHNLTAITGLDNLNYIGGDLRIYHSELLTNIEGFNNVNSIGGDLRIYNNDVLASLNGLNNINSIGGFLQIQGNNLLTSISGLENIAPGTIHDLIIKINNILSTCEVQSVCDYLADPAGIIDIENNAPGCNSQQEVEDACWTSVEEIIIDDRFTISPNPLNSTTLIQYTLHQSSPVIIQILDLSGRLVVSLINEFQHQGEQRVVFNTAALPAGIYFCVLKTSEGVQTRKIIKL